MDLRGWMYGWKIIQKIKWLGDEFDIGSALDLELNVNMSLWTFQMWMMSHEWGLEWGGGRSRGGKWWKRTCDAAVLRMQHCLSLGKVFPCTIFLLRIREREGKWEVPRSANGCSRLEWLEQVWVFPKSGLKENNQKSTRRSLVSALVWVQKEYSVSQQWKSI